MYNLLNTSGHLTISEMQFQKKVVQAREAGLEFVEYLRLRLPETESNATSKRLFLLVPSSLYGSTLFTEEFNFA